VFILELGGRKSLRKKKSKEAREVGEGVVG